MADVTYRIIIEGMGSGAADATPKTTAATPSGDDVSPKPSPSPSGGGTGGIADLYRAIKKSAAVGLALKYVNLFATTEINRVELRTGRATYQAELNYKKSAAMRGLAIGGSFVGAAITGNPLLAVAGVVSAVDWGLEIGIAQENLNIERAVSNVSIGMANIRAGAGGDRFGKSGY
ncbi:MAG: hypothetical protein IKL79_01295 [Clostridia bacterium]|nr:hypothetical protein [Clostridia bacterium]